MYGFMSRKMSLVGYGRCEQHSRKTLSINLCCLDTIDLCLRTYYLWRNIVVSPVIRFDGTHYIFLLAIGRARYIFLGYLVRALISKGAYRCTNLSNNKSTNTQTGLSHVLLDFCRPLYSTREAKMVKRWE